MHVRDQIVAAVVDRITQITGAPFGQRVYAQKPLRWDKETLPIAVVFAGATRGEEEDGYESTMVNRQTEILVHVIGREYANEDITQVIGGYAVAVEQAVTGLGEDLPIEDVQYLEDTGITGASLEAEGAFAATQITFGVSYYTRKGNAAEFVAGNY